MSARDVFLAALEFTDPAERAAYLDRVCANDADLRRRVEILLRVEAQSSGFLDQPAAMPASGEAPTRSGGFATSESLEFLARSEKPELLGTLDHYEVLEVVGRGGMGVVLKAFDPKLRRIVAIKVMAPEFAARPAARARFAREARAVAAVRNDHVVAIHAVETERAHPYLVMEFIAGQSLQQRIDRNGALGVKEILRIAHQAACGLAAAHAQGIVHRDIKPANILLENGVERVKLTDFGLARAMDDASLTQSGVITGTPNYMSPEQADGKQVDHRSDLFSLGSVIYAMATGYPPFRAEGLAAVLKRVAADEPHPLRELNAEVPEWLEAIVAKLQAKDPSERFQTADEVADLLSKHLAHLQQPAHVPMPDRVEAPSTWRSPNVIRVRATSRGRVVSWSHFRQDQLVSPNLFERITLFTTILTDVVTDLLALAESLDPNYRLVTLSPNGPTTSSFHVMISGKGFEFVCARRLVRGLFPLNPFSAEFGSNYDIIVTINSATPEARSKIVEMLQSKYDCTPRLPLSRNGEPTPPAKRARKRRRVHWMWWAYAGPIVFGIALLAAALWDDAWLKLSRPPAHARIEVSWNTDLADRVVVSGDVFREFRGGAYDTGTWLPPGRYSIRAFKGEREVYGESFSLTQGEHRKFAIGEKVQEPHLASLRVVCQDPSLQIMLKRNSRWFAMSIPGERTTIEHGFRAEDEYELTIQRYQHLLHMEKVKLGIGQRRELVISPIITPKSTVNLKPKSGSFPSDVTQMTISPDRSVVAVARLDGPILVFDAATGAERLRIDRFKSHSPAFAFAPDSRSLAFLTRLDGTKHVVRFVDTASGEQKSPDLQFAAGAFSNALAMAISPDGKRLAISSAENLGRDTTFFRSRIVRWERTETTWKELPTMEWQDGTIKAMRFSPDGSMLVAIADQMREWTWADGRNLPRGGGKMDVLAFGPSSRAFGGMRDKGETHSLIQVMSRDAFLPAAPKWFTYLASLAVSPDGNYVAAGNKSIDATSWESRAAIRIWHTRTGAEHAVLLGHTDWILDLAFAPNGEELVSTGKDGTVKTWKLP